QTSTNENYSGELSAFPRVSTGGGDQWKTDVPGSRGGRRLPPALLLRLSPGKHGGCPAASRLGLRRQRIGLCGGGQVASGQPSRSGVGGLERPAFQLSHRLAVLRSTHRARLGQHLLHETRLDTSGGAQRSPRLPTHTREVARLHVLGVPDLDLVVLP